MNAKKNAEKKMSTCVNDKVREIEAIIRRQIHDDKDHAASTGKLCGAVCPHTTNRCLEPEWHRHLIAFNARVWPKYSGEK